MDSDISVRSRYFVNFAPMGYIINNCFVDLISNDL